MGKRSQQRARAANRARTLNYRRSRSSHALQRRVFIVLGIFIALVLILGLVATVSSPSSPVVPTVASSDNGPQSMIAAATANPNDPDTVGALASYFDQTGQYDRALDLYQHYLQLRPTDALAHVTVGELMLASGDANNARAQFTQAIVLNPDPQIAARAHLGLGNAYTALKPPRFADAIAEYQQASTLDPTGQVGDDARSRIAGLQQLTVTPLAPAAPNATPGAASPVARTNPAGTP